MNSFYQLKRKALRVVLFVLLLWVIGVNNGRAERVSTKVAQSVAIAFFNNNGIKSSSVTDVSQEVGFSNLYVFNGESGFVILAADNRVKPILGYSLTGRFVAENMPDNLRWWLQGYNDEIQYAIDNRVVAPINTEKEWSDLERGLSNRTRISKVVEPLITSKWGQNSPYNLQCPEGTSTGCVATAMAQIMYKWRYPICGTGTHTSTGYPELSADFGATIYDWDNMIDTYDEFSTDVQKIAVSTLMLHCGISVDMQYGPQSAASTFDAMLALKNYFGYSMSAFYMSRDIVDDDEEWKTMIKDELDEGRPLQYRGDSDYSHSFVCDGYNNDDYFHFNWGWYGEPDTYFSLDGLVPSGYNFNSNQAAIFGIQPICYTVAVSANLIAGGSVSGSGTYYQNSQCTLTATPNAHYTFTNWTKDNVVVSTDPTYTFTVTEDGAYTANFAAVPQYTITATAVPTAGGSVSGSGTYYQNSQCTLTATSNAHYTFLNWTKDGVQVSNDQAFTFTVTSAGDYTANFIAVPQYIISAVAEPAEGGIVSGAGVYYENSECTLTASPNAHYTFTNWTKNGVQVSTDPTFTFIVTDDATYTANFTAMNPHTITCNTVENGVISSTPTMAYMGNTVSLTAYVNYGCEFSAWIVVDADNNPITVTNNQFIMPDSDVTVDAVITTLTYCVSGRLRYSINSYTHTATVLGLKSGEIATGDLIIYSTIGNSNTVTKIKAGAFSGCSGFTGTLTIPNTVTVIESRAFKGCSGFTGILTIPNSVTVIEGEAFSGCCGFSGGLAIPNSVTSIEGRAFENCTGFTESLSISNSISLIGYKAFEGCAFNGLYIDMVDIPAATSDFRSFIDDIGGNFSGSLCIGNSVVTIGEQAFWHCDSFNGLLTISNSVTSIGNSAFSGCSGLTGSLTIPNSVTKIGDYAFGNCSGFTGTLTISNSVTTIGDYVFSDCSGFTGTLTIPNSVISIGEGAFRNCSGFTGILTIPNSVAVIESETFSGCSGFSGGLTIPNSVTSIGNSAFKNCSGFTGPLTIPNSVTELGYAQYEAFEGCTFNGLNIDMTHIPRGGFRNFSGELVIGNSVLEIGDGAFAGCSGFTGTLTIPNTVTKIGFEAFDDCSGFTGTLSIPNSVTVIEGGAFYGCSGFSGGLTIPNSVTSIGWRTFSDCSGFTGTLTIPNSVTVIEDEAFYGCSGFSGGLTIPNSVISIGESAFELCSGFNGPLTIPNTVTSIGYCAFHRCSGLTGPLTIPNSLTSIESGTFWGCSGLTGPLAIPSSVTVIGSYAFEDCNSLNSVHYNGTIAQWCNISFGDYYSNPLYYAHNLYIGNELVTNLVIPETVTEIKNYTFYGCSGLTGSLSIPSSVTTIGNSAFYECSGFTGTLSISNSVESIGSYAFSYCSGLNSVRIQCSTPPTIAQSSFNFNGADKTIPIFVPCGTQDDYKTAQYWSEFENINESPYNLVITSNDKLGGEISVLEYADCEDNHCAILAVPNIGYNFLGWYVDDYFATITPFCDFSLTEDVTFEARFEMLPNHNVANGTSNLWSDPGTWFLGEVPDATSTVGIRKNVIVDVDADVSAVGIYGNSTLTVLSGVTLTVTDTLGSTENSSIMIQDGGQLVHSNGEAKATIQKSIEPYTSEDDGWNLISFPLVGNGDLTTIGNMLSNQYDLYAYDEPTEVWKNQKYESNDFTSLEAGVGYLYANKGTATDIVPVGEQIGEGTSTIGYTPFYTYYKYSIAENLFLASELLTAGLSTTPIGALYWYATNETGYVQSNISIWMANVDDAELTTTSHNVSEMTLVYTGNMTPVTGWNPFVFNENSFAWDGVSNLLVCVQRNNGAWNSAINWRAHNPGFDAVSYKYTDSNAYDMATETYSMSVTLLRPDTFFQTTDQVGQQSANYLPITMSFAGELENGTAEVTVPLSYTEGIGLAGFNLVGNPFVHNVTSYTGTNVADGCFRLNDTRDNLIVSEISASNPLKPIEGFFVKATATEASITFNHQTRGEKTKRGVINMELSADGKIIDRLLVRNDGDPLEKLSLGHSKARLFVVKGRQEMAAVPMEGNEQPICFKTAKTGTYTITVNLEGMELNYLYLIDHMTGANVNLLVEPSYSFEARNSDYESRFQLLYFPKEASGADDESFAFINNGSIIIMGEYSNATLQIVDMTGRLVYSLNGRIQCVPTEGIASGAYVLRLINGNETRTQKIIVK